MEGRWQDDKCSSQDRVAKCLNDQSLETDGKVDMYWYDEKVANNVTSRNLTSNICSKSEFELLLPPKTISTVGWPVGTAAPPTLGDLITQSMKESFTSIDTQTGASYLMELDFFWHLKKDQLIKVPVDPYHIYPQEDHRSWSVSLISEDRDLQNSQNFNPGLATQSGFHISFSPPATITGMEGHLFGPYETETAINNTHSFMKDGKKSSYASVQASLSQSYLTYGSFIGDFPQGEWVLEKNNNILAAFNIVQEWPYDATRMAFLPVPVPEIRVNDQNEVSQIQIKWYKFEGNSIAGIIVDISLTDDMISDYQLSSNCITSSNAFNKIFTEFDTPCSYEELSLDISYHINSVHYTWIWQ